MNKCPMKTRLKGVGVAFAVIAVVVCLLAVSSYVVYPKNNQAEFGMIYPEANGVAGERRNSIDALFIGDSIVYSAMSPLQMWGEQGITGYVCATPGQRLTYGNMYLRRALENQTPKVVMFDANSIYAPFGLSGILLRTLQDVFPVIEYHNRWKNLGPQDVLGPVKATWSDDMKGFQGDMSVSAVETYSQLHFRDTIPLPNQLYLKSMIDYCKERGITCVLVSLPTTVNWSESLHNGIAAFAEKEGIDFIDMNANPEQVGIDWEVDTRDAGDHLNLSGAKKATSYIARILRETYGLPDHRGDQAYSSWNDSYERYLARFA